MQVTIVMYHYVRDFARTRYPEIKGLDIQGFRTQLEGLRSLHTLIGMEDLLKGLDDPDALPERAALLTFDDGYAEHFTTVFPILHQLRVLAAFYPVPKAILEGRVLGVNKVHFVLSAVSDKHKLAADVQAEIEGMSNEPGVQSPEFYWSEYAKASRFDPPEIVFVKRVLQKGLPEPVREEIADRLFRKYVTHDEASFASELYMTTDQLRTLHDCGMHIGSHSYSHYWMDTLSPAQQEDEVAKSVGFLRTLGGASEPWTMCYPYGAHNESLLTVLERAGCAAGFTTRSATAQVRQDHRLRLPRFDTTEIARSAAA